MEHCNNGCENGMVNDFTNYLDLLELSFYPRTYKEEMEANWGKLTYQQSFAGVIKPLGTAWEEKPWQRIQADTCKADFTRWLQSYIHILLADEQTGLEDTLPKHPRVHVSHRTQVLTTNSVPFISYHSPTTLLCLRQPYKLLPLLNPLSRNLFFGAAPALMQL